MDDRTVTTWRKATYSGTGNGNCVEVASADGVLIRDTTNRDGVTLGVAPQAWSTFLAGLKHS
jgi:hypothetical protein